MRRRVWLHRGVAVLCVLLVYPAIRWWSESVLFVILISLATQGYASLAASEAADEHNITDRLDRIEAHLARQAGDRGQPQDT